MSIEIANRLHTVEEYYFSKKLREVATLAAKGNPIINMGIGSPDTEPPTQVVEALKSSLTMATAHKYQSYQGLPDFRMAIANFYKEKYKVVVNHNNQILPLMGSKEGIMHISMAFLNEGDQALIPNPGYPTYTSVTRLVGAEPLFYDLSADENWLPDLKKLEMQDLSKVKLMWINYPHMPTGASATVALFSDLISFAKKHDILIVNDNPYSFILNDAPMSLLTHAQNDDPVMELNSLSKTFNMAGWRVGMLVGPAALIQNVLKVKSNMDSGMFYGIQKGAIAALRSAETWYDSMNDLYRKRREWVWKLADVLGCQYDRSASGMFVWAKLPKGAPSSEEFIDEILYNKHVFITPGTIFGPQGEGYIRFSLCVSEELIKEALNRWNP
jgi:aspartate/methionine/tyrosine aminotransferase